MFSFCSWTKESYFLRFTDNWNMYTHVVALKFIGKGSLFLPEKETSFISFQGDLNVVCYSWSGLDSQFWYSGASIKEPGKSFLFAVFALLFTARGLVCGKEHNSSLQSHKFFTFDSWYPEFKMSEATFKQQQQEKPLGKSSLRFN